MNDAELKKYCDEHLTPILVRVYLKGLMAGIAIGTITSLIVIVVPALLGAYK
jgi:hypothetical protein